MAKKNLDRQQVGDLVVKAGSENHNNKKHHQRTTITIISSSGEASGIDPQAFYRGCGEPGVPAGQGLTCTVEQLFDVKVLFDLISKL